MRSVCDWNKNILELREEKSFIFSDLNYEYNSARK